jgi:uncharacterized metal-binding protein
MSEISKPWLILPCSGIGKSLGTITRWTAYEILENKNIPNVHLLCLARLVDADSEAISTLSTHRIITIDGCPKKCATINVEKNHASVEKEYLMAKFLAKNKDIKLENNVIDPGIGGVELSKRIAREIEDEIRIDNGGI